MKCRILSEIDGRMRVRLFMPRMSLKQADIVEEYLGAVAGVKSVKVFDRNCDVVVEYSDRAAVVSALSGFSFETCGITEPKPTGRELNREYQDKLAGVVMRRVLKKALLPAPWRAAICAAKCSQYFARGVKSLWHKRLDVAVLDATAITVSVLRGDTDTASSIMFMLEIGDILEEWTHKKSVDDLARTMSLNVDRVWVKLGDTEELKNISDVNVGDEIIVRMGSMIPLDGKLVSGSAAVNQSSMTGESMPVRKEVGSYVYGGTVVEEGECVIRVEKSLGSGRYDRIVHMIEDSEKLKIGHRVAGVSPCRQARAVQSRRNGADMAHNAQPDQGACHTHGRFLLRAEAFHADRGALGHARERRERHLRQGRQVP